MSPPDLFNTQGAYSNPKVVDGLVNNFNQNNPAHQITQPEREILKKDSALTTALFFNGVISLVSARATTVTELHKQPPELVQFLAGGRAKGLVKDNVVTVQELGKIAPEKLKQADQSLTHGNISDAAKALGLDKERMTAFMDSISRTDMERFKEEQPQHDHNPRPGFTPLPNVPLTPVLPKRIII